MKLASCYWFRAPDVSRNSGIVHRTRIHSPQVGSRLRLINLHSGQHFIFGVTIAQVSSFAEVMTAGKDVKATLPYLAKIGLYKEQKPFATDFIPSISDVSLTNHAFEFLDLVVTDARPTRDSYTLDEEGFCFLTAPTLVTSSVVDDKAWMEENYYSEVESVLHDAFPEYSRLECLDYQVLTDVPLQPWVMVSKCI